MPPWQGGFHVLPLAPHEVRRRALLHNKLRRLRRPYRGGAAAAVARATESGGGGAAE